MILRNDNWTIGIKAGCNADNHNHNDTGSVTLYKNGNPFLVDIGVESYSAKTFSDHRYEIWTMQSDYHNLPTLNSFMQSDGKEYFAEIPDLSLSENGGDITMELSKAYPENAGVISYVRRVSLDQTNSDPIIKDSWHLTDMNITEPVILNLITCEKPVACDNMNIGIGDLGMIRIDIPQMTDKEPSVTIEELPITDERLKICWKHSLAAGPADTTGQRCVHRIITERILITALFKPSTTT